MLHSFSLYPFRIVAIYLEFWLPELGSISHCLREFCFGFVHLFSTGLLFLPFIFWGCQSHLKLSMEKLNYFLYLSPKPQHCRSLTSANVLSTDILYGYSHSVFLLSSTLVSSLDTRLENVFCVGVSSWFLSNITYM